MTPEQCRAARRAAMAHVQVELSARLTAIPSQITGKLVRIFADSGHTLKLGNTISFPVSAPFLGTEPAAEAWVRALYVEAYLNLAPTGWWPVPGQLTLMRGKSDIPINPAETDSLGATIGPDLWAAPAGAAPIVVSPPSVRGVFRDHWNELDKAKRIAYIVVAILFTAFILGRIYFSMQASGKKTNGVEVTPSAAKIATQDPGTHLVSFYREHPGGPPSGLVFRKPPGTSEPEGEVEGLIDCQAKRQMHLSVAFDQSREPGLTYYEKEWRLQGRPFNLYMNLEIDGKRFNIAGAKIISWKKTPMHSVVGAVAFFSDDLYQAIAGAHSINFGVGNSKVTGSITNQRDAMKALAGYCAN